MFKSIVMAAVGATVLAGCATAQEAPAKAQIMILGTYHFAGGTDAINPEVDDYLSDRRQAEIADVLNHLEAFAPTVIALEDEPVRQSVLDERYASYRAGGYELSANEIDQIGIALAARLDLPGVVGVDFRDGMDIPGALEAAGAAGQQDLIQQFQETAAMIGEAFAKVSTPDTPVIDQLRFHNGPEVASFHNLYLLLAEMGDVDNPVGAVEMSRWWARNVRIYANIARHAEPGDRVLVIYGSGHKFLLDQLVEHSQQYELVDPLDYLN